MGTIITTMLSKKKGLLFRFLFSPFFLGLFGFFTAYINVWIAVRNGQDEGHINIVE